MGPTECELGGSTLISLSHSRGGLGADHRVASLVVHDEVRPTLDDNGTSRTLTIGNPGATAVDASVEVRFEPYLAPVLMEGVKPHRYSGALSGSAWIVRSFGFAFAWEMDPAPSSVLVGAEPWDGSVRKGPMSALSFRWTGPIPPASSVELHQRIVGGLLASALSERARVPRAEPHCTEYETRFRHWVDRSPVLSFPDAPELETGYALARAALRSLYTAPDAAIAGLVAGYPWYPALWCRDLAWMLPAVQWLGDFAWVERAIRTVFRFQARSEIPILGGRPGELPMQIAPGPVFLYGTSDTTLYYPALLRQFADHTGSLELADTLRTNLVQALEWGAAKSSGPGGLMTNGGEVAAMKQETEIGRVRVGFDAVDTTIWDSTDRRDHAIDLQVLWLETLEAMEELARLIGFPLPAGIAGRAERLRSEFAARYSWPEEHYLYDSLKSDGTPIKKVRPNALRSVRVGLLDPETARALVQRAAGEDLTTAWGVRTLSDRDPSYDPIAYHDGEVWTIATAWAAEAALWAGERDLGLAYLLTNARRLIEEEGYAAECYRGDRAEPYNSCFLLGFSIAPFLSNLFGALWGIEPHLTRRSVDLRPRFPDSWRSARIERLRLGPGTLSLDWAPGRLGARWSGPGPLELTGALGRWPVEAGGSVSIPLPRESEA